MVKKADFRPARERIDGLPVARREGIEAEAGKILQALHLSEIRKALSATQSDVAQRTGLKQAEVSRIENAPETVQLKTMDRYVSGLGGVMKIVAEFPDGTFAEVPIARGKPVRSKATVSSGDRTARR